MELIGVIAAVASSAIGGASIALTRFVVTDADPFLIGAFRFGIGFALLLPLACLGRTRWPARADLPAVAALGLLFFGMFPVLFNASLAYTTAARAALALSMLPLLTMIIAALLGVEALTRRKLAGVCISTSSVVIALTSGLAYAPAGAWRGDLLMLAAAVCMALYNVWSRPFIARSGAIPFTCLAMGVGGAVLIVIALCNGGAAQVKAFGPAQWWTLSFLGAFGGALTFYLWAAALARTTPTRVALSVTVNPIVASIVAAFLLAEPLQWTIGIGLLGVMVGIWLATTGAGGRCD